MMFIIFLSFMVVLCTANGKEERATREEIFKEFCKGLNLVVGVFPNSDKCTVTVYFKLENSIDIGCFLFYDVYLLREKEEAANYTVMYDYINGNAFYKFQNVTSGVYRILIKPNCTLKKCPRMEIEYGQLIDMTNSPCIATRNETPTTSAVIETSTTSITKSFKEFCEELNLMVGVNQDSEKCTVAVQFKLENSIHTRCFHFYDVYLIREKEETSVFRVKYNDINGYASHTFQNVTRGVYKILIKPFCSSKNCRHMEVEYKRFIDMTNSICISNRNETPTTSVMSISATSAISETSTTPIISVPTTPVVNETSTNLVISVPTIPVISETSRISAISKTSTTFVLSKIYTTSAIKEAYTSAPNGTKSALIGNERRSQNSLKQRTIIIIMTPILLLIICIIIHLARRKRKESLNRIPEIALNHYNNENCVVQNTDIDIEVYILNYYDRKGKMKKKVEVIKDFLLKLSYFKCIKEIEDELAFILFNANNWLNDVLCESRKDGTVKRVILITSQEENELNDDDIENQIYSTFLKKIKNKDEQCVTGNNNIYFVQLDNSTIHSVKCRNIVWQHQYSLCGESTLDHMIDLCLNLCSELRLEPHLIEQKIKELYMNHPVRHFGSSLKFVECV